MMNIHEFFEMMKEVQESFLNIIDCQETDEDSFRSFFQVLDKFSICDDHHKMKQFLFILIQIANNHKRCPHFYEKIDKILANLKPAILKFFTNLEAFNLFKDNKRILLFLINENVITVDKNIAKLITEYPFSKAEYYQYFFDIIKEKLSMKELSHYKECQQKVHKFRSESLASEEELTEIKENQKRGENESYITSLIRRDAVEEFIVYINQTNFSLSSKIKLSIFETNQFLFKITNKYNIMDDFMDTGTPLIEYAAFFGAVDIFKYLQINGAELTPSLWIAAIHGRSPEIIHLLEDNHVAPSDESFVECLKESIKCHHNEIADYILTNFIKNHIDISKLCLKYYNFSLLQDYKNINQYFYDLCKYDYYFLVDLLLNNENVNVNMKHVLFIVFIKFILKYLDKVSIHLFK